MTFECNHYFPFQDTSLNDWLLGGRVRDFNQNELSQILM